MKILIVGGGGMGQRHMSMARYLFPMSEIKMWSKHNSNKVINKDELILKLDDALKFKPNISVIANPATFHLQIAQELVVAGSHLLVEKPLSTSTLGLARLIKTCEKNNLILMTGYNLRFSSSLSYFRELLKNKIVGKVLSIRSEAGQYLPDWRPDRDYRKTVSANFSLGGGVLLELSHEIDYLRWIFGDIDWVRATLSKQSSLEIDVEDSAHLVLGFESSTAGNQLIANLNLDFIRHDQTRICTVIGDKGTLRWNGLTGTVDIFLQNSEKWEVLCSNKPDTDKTLLAEWENFLGSIKQKCHPLITGTDGLRVLEIIEAARKSSATGSQVEVIKNPVYFENTP